MTDPIPQATIDWLIGPDNPAVSVLTRRTLLGVAAGRAAGGGGTGRGGPSAQGATDEAALDELWARRNEYPPVRAILEGQLPDGSWAPPARDYQKYRGSLWQVHFLGELRADGADERVRRGAEYAFSRQLPDGSFSATNMRPDGSIACLTANVGRALARLGWSRDERVGAALAYCTRLHRELGIVDCRWARPYQLNGYCHMLAPKTLLFLAEVTRELWPDGATDLRDECVAKLRDKEVFRCLPKEAREFNDRLWAMPSSEREGFREAFLEEHRPLNYKEKPGWLRFGFPISYNSDVLEALTALAAVGEPRRAEYEPALEVVRAAADDRMRWTMRNSLNGKMIGDVEEKCRPSKWLTLRALEVLAHFGE